MNDIQKTYKQQIEEVVEVCRRAGELGFGAASGGNVSYRVADDVVLITPTGIVKRKIEFDDICIVNGKGEEIYVPQGRKPTGEMFMHLHILEKRPDVKGIMHAHPPVLIGMSLSEYGRKAMLLPLLPEAMTQLGPVFTIPYVQPNGEELGYSFDPYIMRSNGFIMANHGCLVCSSSGVLDTVESVQVMESMAKSLLTNKVLGNDVRVLSGEEMDGLDSLLAARKEKMPGPAGNYRGMRELFEGLADSEAGIR